MKATRIKDLSDSFTGTATLWRCDPPVEGHEYVVTSATVALYSGPETYLFPADSEGEVTDWLELDPSERGCLDERGVLELAGYQIVEDA